CPFREVGRCHEGNLVVNHNALGMKAGANRKIGGKRAGVVVDAWPLRPRPMVPPETFSESGQDLVLWRKKVTVPANIDRQIDLQGPVTINGFRQWSKDVASAAHCER